MLMDTKASPNALLMLTEYKQKQSRRAQFYFHPRSIFHPRPLTSTFRGSSAARDHTGDGPQPANSNHATTFYVLLSSWETLPQSITVTPNLPYCHYYLESTAAETLHI